MRRWNSYKSIIDNNEYIYLFYASNAVNIIPKKTFDSEVDLNHFLTIIEKHINLNKP